MAKQSQDKLQRLVETLLLNDSNTEVELHRIFGAMNFAAWYGFTPYVEPLFSEYRNTVGDTPLFYLTYCDYNGGKGESAKLEVDEVADWLKNKTHEYLHKDPSRIRNATPPS